MTVELEAHLDFEEEEALIGVIAEVPFPPPDR